MTSVKFYLLAYSSWCELEIVFFEIYCMVIKPELDVIAIYCDFGLNLELHDQSFRVVTSAKWPKSLEYKDIFLSVPVITKYYPDVWKFIDMGLHVICLSLNLSLFSPFALK